MITRWREALRSRLKNARVPPELTEEVMCYQQSQLLSTPQFIVQLPQIPGLTASSEFPMGRTSPAVG